MSATNAVKYNVTLGLVKFGWIKGQGPRLLPNIRLRHNSALSRLTRLLISRIDGLIRADL